MMSTCICILHLNLAIKILLNCSLYFVLNGVFYESFLSVLLQRSLRLYEIEAGEQEKAGNCLNEFLVRWKEVEVRTQMDFLGQEEKSFPEFVGSQCGGMQA